MKIKSVILSLGIIIEGIFARNLPLVKRDDDECNFVNSLLKNEASNNCCDGKKVICENNYIVKIALSKFDIRNATLPSSVGISMPMLKTFADLKGSIPEDIGNLMNLEELELFDNKLTGPIPDSLGKLSNLNRLILNKNQLSGPIPSTIGDLKSLTLLWLQENQLTSIPEEFGSLTSLHILNLQNNLALSGKVPNTKDIKNIKCNYSNTNVCYTEDDKDTHCTYPSKNYVCTSCKENATLIDGICKCNSDYLGEGYIECYNDCIFVNSLLGKKVADDCCSYDTNKIKCSNTNRVIEITLEKSDIKKPVLPTNIGSLSNLEKISLNNNKLSGAILDSIGYMNKLQSIDLSNNGFKCTIPSSISDLYYNLKQLNLGNNQNLSSNKFTGTIPTNIGDLTMLKSLLLSDNEFADLIPTKELEKINALNEINLSNNKELYGQIPNTKNLGQLNQCNFSGTNLCNPKDNADSRCIYSQENYDCAVCKENATTDINNMCQCNEKYTGIGYISCTRIPGTEEEEKSKTDNISDNDLNSSSSFDAFSPKNLKYIFKFVNVVITIAVMGKLLMFSILGHHVATVMLIYKGFSLSRLFYPPKILCCDLV
ncbi:hypothetical protein PIROE2DRAFT_14258 [Piromyces sp. E2]|nr:hypothetical protein PIROE2DRAFT_14258 [Piromyces sp. E2]|eukprot:OUM60066.1 hypothetical protein PIROE2DRAFT_14258 [Piromyces sp. E2]